MTWADWSVIILAALVLYHDLTFARLAFLRYHDLCAANERVTDLEIRVDRLEGKTPFPDMDVSDDDDDGTRLRIKVREIEKRADDAYWGRS